MLVILALGRLRKGKSPLLAWMGQSTPGTQQEVGLHGSEHPRYTAGGGSGWVGVLCSHYINTQVQAGAGQENQEPETPSPTHTQTYSLPSLSVLSRSLYLLSYTYTVTSVRSIGM